MPNGTRRSFLAATAGVGAVALPQKAQAGAETKPKQPKFTLSCNLELMFPKETSHARRIEIAAAEGMKAYSFWGPGGKDLVAIQKTASKLGVVCGSICGNAITGWSTGLTKTGAEKAFLDELAETSKIARRLECQNLVSFLGVVQKDIPWAVQYKQIIEGLKKAGDAAEKNDVYITLEPLNGVEAPAMSMITTKEAFAITAEVNHPRIRIDYDVYHRQLSDGNIINNLRLGIKNGWIRFVEIGDVPGRFEPGTGETNYANVFAVLRELDYAGYVGMEHRASKTPALAIEVVKKVARG